MSNTTLLTTNLLCMDHWWCWRVEAPFPDGIHLATLNASSNEGFMAMARYSLSSRPSYATAFKAKLIDWYLEFSMDDRILPLDLTIYGDIHQHETRKKSGAILLNMIWQRIYMIKFKISGLIPSFEGIFKLIVLLLTAHTKSWPWFRSFWLEKLRLGDELEEKIPKSCFSLSSRIFPHAKVLRLPRVLCQLNAIEAERVQAKPFRLGLRHCVVKWLNVTMCSTWLHKYQKGLYT